MWLPSGRTDKVYLFFTLSDHLVNEYGTSNQLINRYDYGAELIRGELGGEGERFYFSDALGSTTSLATPEGNGAGRYEYDAWGVSYTPAASANRVGYTGQRLDPETGLMALGNGERYYAAVMGQFIQEDSLAGSLTNPQSMNRHSYVTNNPLVYTDPTGHMPENSPVMGGPLIDPFRDMETFFDLAEKSGWISESTARKGRAFVKGIRRGIENLVWEPGKLSLDLTARALGVEWQAQSSTVQQYDHYRSQGKDWLEAVELTAKDIGYGVVTLGIGPAIEQKNELDKLLAAGEISEAEYDEALYGMGGELVGGLIAGAGAGRLLAGVRGIARVGVGKIGRAAGKVAREGLDAAKSGLRALKRDGGLAAREVGAVARDFGRGFGARMEGVYTGSGGGALQEGLERIGAGLHEVRQGRTARRAASGRARATDDLSTALRSEADPLRDKYGPARLSHPEEFEASMAELRQAGVDIDPRPGALGYSPEKGTPGRFIFDPEGSIGALRHEMRHFRDIREAGYPGYRPYFEDPNLFWRLEFRGGAIKSETGNQETA